MGRHARETVTADRETVALQVMPGGLGLYPRPGETPEQKARWLDRSWTLFREMSWDDRLFGLMPYDLEVCSKPAIDRETGRRRGRSVKAA
jgi:hypothetical protein